MIEGLGTGEEQVQAMVRVLGIDEITARFIISIETGEVDGDVVFEGEEPEEQSA